jgi:hypothetical protein
MFQEDDDLSSPKAATASQHDSLTSSTHAESTLQTPVPSTGCQSPWIHRFNFHSVNATVSVLNVFFFNFYFIFYLFYFYYYYLFILIFFKFLKFNFFNLFYFYFF